MGKLAELSIAGRVALSTDPDWDTTRRAWNLAADQHPRAVALVENAGALAMLDAGFVTFGLGIAMTPELAGSIEERLDPLAEAMQPWASGSGYLNFAERPYGLDAILPEEACARLAEVKRRRGPDGMIRATHAIAPVSP